MGVCYAFANIKMIIQVKLKKKKIIIKLLQVIFVSEAFSHYLSHGLLHARSQNVNT